MRIALLNPTYWPEVRRGSERLVHDLGTVLARRGHDVTLLTSHRHRSSSTVEDGMRVVRSYRPPEPAMLSKYEYHLVNTPNVVRRLLAGNFDVAHAFFPSDAWAAVRSRRFGGPPVVAAFHGMPTRQYLVVRRYRLQMIREVIDRAAITTVLSEAAARAFRRYLLMEPRILPGGLFVDDFAGNHRPASDRAIVCAASLNDPRKRAELLLNAFSKLRRQKPDLRLLLAGSNDPILQRRSLTLPPGVEWISADRTESLAHAYASAAASVLPAVEEAFGLVLLESLAAGTPVVAADSGACPELIRDEAIGRLFQPDDEDDLVRAMGDALELGDDPNTRSACERHARCHDWNQVAPLYERTYAEAIAD